MINEELTVIDNNYKFTIKDLESIKKFFISLGYYEEDIILDYLLEK